MQYFVSKRGTSAINNMSRNASVLYASYINKDEFLHIPRTLHCHENCLELVLALSGSCIINIDGSAYTAEAGDIITYNNRIYHRECSEQSHDFSLYCIGMTGVQVSGLPGNCLSRKDASKIISTGSDFELFKMLFSRIYHLAQIDDVKQAELLENYLHVLLSEVVPRYSPDESYAFLPLEGKTSPAEQIRSWLSQHYKEKITLKDVADALALSQDYISHSFKNQFHYSPMQYVTTLRIGEAQIRLIETNDKIADIAMDVGFNNIGNFNRSFLDVVGVPPRKFRQIHSNTPEK